MQNPGKALDFPKYNPGAYENIRTPDLNDDKAVSALAMCWDQTRDMDVPQFRDGECEIRRLWDEAVANALGWNPDKLAALRTLLHNEPSVRGLGREQFRE